MFIAALFTIAKMWKQPKRSWLDIDEEEVEVEVVSHKYSAIKNKEILPFATTWMNLEGFIPSKISQVEKDKYCMNDLTYTLNLNKTKQKQTQKKRSDFGYQRQRVGVGWMGGKWSKGTKFQGAWVAQLVRQPTSA